MQQPVQLSLALLLLLLLLLPDSSRALDNGLALTPPMGWRSWNCFHADINQTDMEAVMDKMAARTFEVDGVRTSLLDLGYDNCGLDDNWQACGSGYLGSFHDSSGQPLVNKDRFPDMKAMTQRGHALGLRVGWYLNNCICSEHEFTGSNYSSYVAKHMQRSAAAVAEFGFDGVKLDGCGQFLNLTWWSQLLNATGRPVLIENCHWGGTVPGQKEGDGPCTGTTPISNCPYSFYRTSTDISNNWGSMWSNLQTTKPYQDVDKPLSRPGSWAYPDMLEVGRMASTTEDRSHFGAWVIVSAPLILGYDVRDDSVTERIWPFIANPEAIAVNQAWNGHPGRLLEQSTFTCRGGGPETQTWVKPLSGSKVAVFVINNDQNAAHAVNITTSDLQLSGDILSLRDVWERKDLPDVAAGSYTTDIIAPHDSRLFVFGEK